MRKLLFTALFAVIISLFTANSQSVFSLNGWMKITRIGNNLVFGPVGSRVVRINSDTVNVSSVFLVNGVPISPGGGDMYRSDTLTKISTWTMDNLRLLKADTNHFLHLSNLTPYLLKADTNHFIHSSDLTPYLLKVDTNHFAHISDTTGATSIAGALWVGNKFATIANLTLKLNKTDTTSFLHLSNLTPYLLKADTNHFAHISDTTGANSIAGATWVKGRFATLSSLAGYYARGDTSVVLGSKTWCDGRFAPLGGGGGSSNWKDTLTATIVPITNKNVYIKGLTIGTSITSPRYLTTATNVIIGNNISASLSNTSSVLIGNYAGYALTTAQTTVCIGYSAGQNGTNNAWLNTFVGPFSGENSNGQENIYLGHQSGRYMTTESGRIILNSLGRTNKAGDTTLSAVYIYEAPTTLGQIIYLNGIAKLPVTADPPTVNVQEGMIYCDTDHHIYYYNGSTWKQLDN